MNSFATVCDAFLHSVYHRPDELALLVVNDSGTEQELTNRELYRMACSAAAYYNKNGIQKNDRVLLAAGASPAFFAAYLGAWFSGVCPLVITPVKKIINDDAAVHRLETWINACNPAAVFLQADYEKPVQQKTPVNIQLLLQEEPVTPVLPQPEDVAHLQGTSGSTALPKMAVVKHRHIAANIRGIGTAIQHQKNDRLVSWLPLSHDMGLIGFSYALGWQCPFIVADTSYFTQNPFNWLTLMAKHKGTLTPAPNAAYHACGRLAKLRPPKNIDLSNWRVALCGSEPVLPKTIQQFEQTFSAFGFKPEVMLPVYGLAEATLAVTVPGNNVPPVIRHFNKTMLETEHRAVEADSVNEAGSIISLVALGAAIHNHHIRIMRNNNTVAAAGELGEVQVKGDSVIDEYWNNEPATALLKTADGYLHTGDTGFIFEEQLFITGRIKDIVILGGRNFSPALLEQTALQALESFYVTTVAATGLTDTASGTEFLHILAEQRKPLTDELRFSAESKLREAMLQEHQVTGIFIHWLPKGGIPHTTSGKVQRYLCRDIAAKKINE